MVHDILGSLPILDPNEGVLLDSIEATKVIVRVVQVENVESLGRTFRQLDSPIRRASLQRSFASDLEKINSASTPKDAVLGLGRRDRRLCDSSY